MAALREGRVIVNYRRQMDVETPEGERVTCLTRGRRLQPVCGDRVRWREQADGTGVIEEILPRHSLLFRYDPRRQRQPLAANLDRMIIVTAPEPRLEPFLIDKYLVAAEAIGVRPLIALNKLDLLEDGRAYAGLLSEYEALGYPTLRLSAARGEGVQALAEALRDHRAVLVGASGTGKSSILQALLPGVDIRTGEISRARGEGRHTTTRTTLYALPGGGELIDSPGVRDFMLWPMPVTELREHFVEFREPGRACRFNDCTHREEPGCGVRAAVERGAIPRRRYDSYRGLAKIMEAQYQAY